MRCVRALLFAVVVLPVSLAGAADRPNVLFLFSDDQQHDAIAALGNTEIHTPQLDRLVRRGSAMTHAFCMGSTSPAVCMPSRAMMLTGRYLFRTAIDVPEDQPMWPEVLRHAGYTTFGTGKWHNPPADFQRAFSAGGSIFFGGMCDHRAVPVLPYDPSGRYDRQRQVTSSVFSSELFANEAIEFLGNAPQVEPFVLYVSFTAPHDPRTPPAEYAQRYEAESLTLPPNFLPVHPFNNGELTVRDERLAPWPRTADVVRQHLADYYAMISHLDAQVGRILDALDESGLRENTIVVFASDHGLAVGQHGLLGKQSLYDHSVRAPLIFAGPGIPEGQRFDALCYLQDIYPTLCELAGVAVPDGVDGRSLLPVLRGERAQIRDSVFGAYRDFQRMVRTERWKLIRYPHINKSQLFDLAADPYERMNLAEEPEYADLVEELTERLIQWQRRAGDELELTSEKPVPEVIALPPAES